MHIDTVGVPEFWASSIGQMEKAGDGLVRFVVCVERHREVIPVFTFVMTALAVLNIAPDIQAFCRKTLEDHAGADH